MHILGYTDKVDAKKADPSCPLIGGKVNFISLIKKLHKIIAGLKYDVFTMNNLLHDLKFARM